MPTHLGIVLKYTHENQTSTWLENWNIFDAYETTAFWAHLVLLSRLGTLDYENAYIKIVFQKVCKLHKCRAFQKINLNFTYQGKSFLNILFSVGDEQADQKIVCDWFATSYGEVDKEYHEAYSRQILKEIREHLKENDTKPKVASWFGWIQFIYIFSVWLDNIFTICNTKSFMLPWSMLV